MCYMFNVIKFKKFFEKKKKRKWCKGPKTDEKVTSLNAEVHSKTFAHQIFFVKWYCVLD